MSSRPEATPVAGISRSSMAPATTAPGPGAAPAIATSSGERFSPGTNVSANASRVMVLIAVSAEPSIFLLDKEGVGLQAAQNPAVEFVVLDRQVNGVQVHCQQIALNTLDRHRAVYAARA